MMMDRMTCPKHTSRFPLVCVLLVFIGKMALANDVYISQASSGSDNGDSCVTAHAVTFFNNSANWGGAPIQIGPGSTVHLCGNITTTLVGRGNGISGSP